MKTKHDKRPEPIAFGGKIKLPYLPISMATTEWNATGRWRYSRPRFVERFPACQNACPTASDIEAMIAHLEKGEVERAWAAATVENPFPGIMGRICFHPCTDGCSRKDLGGSINIHALERSLADSMGETLPPAQPHFPPSKKRIAIIGSGPAGLSCAYHLKRLGHDVVVFEKEKKAGGILRYGIPPYRLPHEILDREIARLSAMGIQFELGKPVPDATHMQTICQDYDAVFLAAGAHRSKPLGIPGTEAKGVVSGLAFLRDTAMGMHSDLGKRIVVVGGGNTAIDAARTALRLGCDVTVIYRRSHAEMPAFEEEVRAAEEEGVKVKTLIAPTALLSTAGRINAITCTRMELGTPDETGRRRPIPVKGTESKIECDTLITAIGEEIDTSIIPSALHIDGGSLRTDDGGRTEWHNLFAGGDFARNPRTVVDALASGKAGAISIDSMLRGEPDGEVLKRCRLAGSGPVLMSRYIEMRGAPATRHSTTEELEAQDRVVDFECINRAYFTSEESAPSPERDVRERISSTDPFVEVGLPLSDESKTGELARCFHCGRCTICDNCYIYCPDIAVSKEGDGFKIDMDYCKGCGVCAQECPRSAIEMVEEETE